MIKRHRIHVFLHVGPAMTPNFVDRFASPGRHSFEAAFSPRAQRYRRSTRIAVGLLIGFAAGLLVAVNLPISEAARLWIALPSAALLPLAVLVHLINVRPRCPSCRKKLTPAKGRYCPQCGAEGFRVGRDHSADCGCTIAEDSGDDARSYRVRGCTHCGVFLDSQGL